MTLGFTEEHSSDFSDSDESGETVRELSAMVCNSNTFVLASPDVERRRTSPTILPSRTMIQLRALMANP